MRYNIDHAMVSECVRRIVAAIGPKINDAPEDAEYLRVAREVSRNRAGDVDGSFIGITLMRTCPDGGWVDYRKAHPQDAYEDKPIVAWSFRDIDEGEAEAERKRVEVAERAQLAALKAKYEGG